MFDILKITDIFFLFILWCGMLPREGDGGQFPYPSVFESTGIKLDR